MDALPCEQLRLLLTEANPSKPDLQDLRVLQSLQSVFSNLDGLKKLSRPVNIESQKQHNLRAQ